MRTWLRGKITLLFMTCAVVLAVPAIALADNAVSDGDGVTPITNQDMAFSGDVACNVATTKDALVAITRQGSGNVFKNGSTVTVTASSTGAGLSVAMGASNTITLPSNWQTLSNGTLSNNVTSTVTVNSSTAGPGTGTVTYTASGTGSDNNPLTRTDTMNVTWNTGSCDTTAPSVTSIETADANPTNTTGNLVWNVTFSESVTGVDALDFNLANDGLGGTPAITNVSGSGANYTVTASSGSGTGELGLNLTDNDSIVDGAGNKLGGTNPGNGDFTGDEYVIDRTNPTATGSAVLGPDFTDPYTAGNWTNQSVRVTFACTDNTGTGGSGLTSTSGNQTLADFTTETSVSGTTANFSGTCTDNAGNTAAASNFGPIKIDKTDPNVALVGGPADDSSHYFGSVPDAPTCSASDALSGLAGPCTVSGYGTTVGSHTVTASATDNADNNATASSTYTVLGWTLNGFKSPVDMGIYNDAKGGSTVPLKFEVFAGPTELTSTNVVDYFTQKISCASGVGDAIEQYSTGNTELRYDTTSGQFIFNWKTPKAPGSCYRVTLQTDDGSQIYADFRLK
jgi:hypothetical protein